MAIEEAIVAKIAAASTITAVVSSRHYWLKPPQAFTLPMIVWRLSSRQRGREVTGLNSKDRSTIEMDCIAETITAARNLADIVIAALDGNTGPASGVLIQQLAIRGESDVYDIDTDLLGRQLTFELAYINT
jgi:hypothetical protein